MGVFICAVYAANTVVLCVAEALAECPVLMRWMAPSQSHRDVPIQSNDSFKTDTILAFAERLLLAKSSRQQVQSITSGLTPTADNEAALSVNEGKLVVNRVR